MMVSNIHRKSSYLLDNLSVLGNDLFHSNSFSCDLLNTYLTIHLLSLTVSLY